MIDVMTELRTQLTRQHVASMDNVLRKAVARVLGDDFLLTDLQGRLQVCEWPDKTVYTLDGKDILTVHPPTLSQRYDDGTKAWCVNVSQQLQDHTA